MPVAEMREAQRAMETNRGKAEKVAKKARLEQSAKKRLKGLYEAAGIYGWSAEKGSLALAPEGFQRRGLAECLVEAGECEREMGNRMGALKVQTDAYMADRTFCGAQKALGEKETAEKYEKFRLAYSSDVIGMIAANVVTAKQTDLIAALSQQWGWKQLVEMKEREVGAVTLSASLVPFGGGVWLNVLLEGVEESPCSRPFRKFFHFSRAAETGADEIDAMDGGSGVATKKATDHCALILPKIIHLLRSEMSQEVAAVQLGQGLRGLAREKGGIFPDDIRMM